MTIDIESDPVVGAGCQGDDESAASIGAANDSPTHGQKVTMDALLTGKEYVSDGLLRRLVSAGVVDVGNAVRILLVMHARHNHENWLSAPGMAKTLGVESVCSVEKTLERLVAEGFCWREGRPGQRRRRWRLGQKPPDAYRRRRANAQNGESQVPISGDFGSPHWGIVNPQTGYPQIPKTGNPQSKVHRVKTVDHSSGSKVRTAGTGTTTTTPDNPSGRISSEELDDSGAGSPSPSEFPVGSVIEWLSSSIASMDERRRPVASASDGVYRQISRRLYELTGGDEDAARLLVGDWVSIRAGGSLTRWNPDWLLEWLLTQPVRPDGRSSPSRHVSPAAASIGSSPDDPADPETGAQLLRRFNAIAKDFFSSVSTTERDARELEASEQALSILTANKCRNQMTIDAWIRWHLSTIKEDEAAKYGVRVRNMVPTWSEFNRFRPRPENALVKAKPFDSDFLWKALDAKIDVSVVSGSKGPETMLMACMSYGVVVVGNHLAHALKSKLLARENLDRMFRWVGSEDPMWAKWVARVYASTERGEAGLGGYPKDLFLSDWRETMADVWAAAGCKPAASITMPPKELVAAVRSLLDRIESGGGAAAAA